MPKIIPTEFEEACILSDWLRLKGYLFSHIAQETFTRSWGTKMKNKRQGVNRGVPDYIIVKNNILIFCELKRTKNGVVGEAQQNWINALNACGVKAFIARGAEEAINIIESIK